VSVAQIGVCIGLEQRPRDCGMTFLRGDDQGSSVAAALIDVAADLDQRGISTGISRCDANISALLPSRFTMLASAPA